MEQGGEDNRWQVLMEAAETAWRQNRAEDVKSCLSEALRQAEAGEPDDLRLPYTLAQLARWHQDRGQLQEAEKIWKRVLSIIEKVLAPDDPHWLAFLQALGTHYHFRGDYAEAEKVLMRALAIARGMPLAHVPAITVAEILDCLGQLFVTQGRYPEAENAYQRAVAYAQHKLGPGHEAVGLVLDHLAVLSRIQGKLLESEQLSQQALAVLQGLQPDHPWVPRVLSNLACVYESQGNDSKAEMFKKRALAIYLKALGPRHRDVAQILRGLGMLYYR
jgi:tetratricopeptide (TPR) repeat protein